MANIIICIHNFNITNSHHLNPQGGKTSSTHPSSPHDPLLSYDPSPSHDPSLSYNPSFSDDPPFSHEILSFHGPYIFDHASDHVSIPACQQPH